MKTKFLSLTILVALLLLGCKDKHQNLKDGLYAEIETPKGTVLLQLEYKKAPVTVANFVSLAEGTNPFVTEDVKGKPFFDGLVFHRVEPGFVIQGGDPLGNGTGDPGYKFGDEFSDLKHNKAGTLSMANSGPNSNGSQFFITLAATPHLDGKHTVFGYVIEGMDVVNNTELNDEISAIKIIRKGEDAKKFDAVKIFSDAYAKQQEFVKQQEALKKEEEKKYRQKFEKVISEKLAYFAQQKSSATKLPSGLLYKITQAGESKILAKGTAIKVAYSGFLENGTLFDTSNPEVAKKFGTFIPERAAQNAYSDLDVVVGEKGKLIPGFEEGITKLHEGDKALFFIPSNLGYGENGAGDVIPPNANIIFEIEIK